MDISILDNFQADKIKTQFNESGGTDSSVFADTVVKGMIDDRLESIIAQVTTYELANHKGIFAASLDTDEGKDNLRKAIRARFERQKPEIAELLRSAIIRACNE